MPLKLIFISVLAVLMLHACNGQKTDTIVPAVNIKGIYCGYLDSKGTLWIGTNQNGLYSYRDSVLKNYTIEDGLCNNKVSCIAEADNGIIYIGTADGVCTYNGNSFKHIPIPWQDTSSSWLDKVYPIINPNEVQSILQDRNGMLWIGTNGAGAYSYDGHDFEHYLYEVGKKQTDSQYHNIVNSIAEDMDGNIWFASMTHGGASLYDGATFTHYNTQDGLTDDMLRVCYTDDSGKVWFGFNGNRKSGISYYNGKTFKSLYQKDGLCSKRIRAIYQDLTGRIWLGGMQGLCTYNTTKHEFKTIKTTDGLPFKSIVFITGDKQGNIWFAGKDALWHISNNRITQVN